MSELQSVPLLHYREPSLLPDVLTREPDVPPPPTPPPTFKDYVPQYPWLVDQAFRITGCESHDGQDPDTYNLEAPDGGPFQINKSSWANFFAAQYGWSWEQVVLDPEIHVHAAYIIFTRAGGRWSPWTCARIVGLG